MVKSVAEEAGELVLELARLKQLSMRRRLRRAVSKHVFLKQHEEAENKIVEALAPVFEAQVREMSDGLLRMVDAKAAGPDDSAEALVAQVYDPKRWRAELIDRALPLMAVEMAKAVKAQRAEIGLEPKD